MARRNWTVEEVRQALSLYLRLSFGKFHSRNPQVQALARIVGRTPSAVAMKLSNLAALDDSLPQRGMANASATDRKVWADFLAAPDAVVTALQTQQDAPDLRGFAERQAHYESQQGTSPAAKVTPRVGQSFFREMILTSYNGRCALTGTDDPRLLTASHIVGWAEAPEHRLKPTNGICLNALHDRAFDRHLITFDDNDRMVIAPDVPAEARAQLQRGVTQLQTPDRFLPDPAFLEVHRRRFHTRQRAL